MQGDPKPGGEWGFIAFLHCLMAEMPFRCKQAFPREEKCLLDLLHSVLQFMPVILTTQEDLGSKPSWTVS
jgi:hypothetical protein